MEPNYAGHQDDHQSGQGIDPLPGPSHVGDSNQDGTGSDWSIASEVMDITYEVTLASAQIYELVANLAEFMVRQQTSNVPSIDQPNGQHITPLLEIIKSTNKTEVRIRLLESRIIGNQSEELDAFLKDCWSALGTFNEVGRSLAGIIGLDEWEVPSSTGPETLKKVIERLDTCSGIIPGLPASGLIISYQCLVETAFNLQHSASELSGTF